MVVLSLNPNSREISAKASWSGFNPGFIRLGFNLQKLPQTLSTVSSANSTGHSPSLLAMRCLVLITSRAVRKPKASKISRSAAAAGRSPETNTSISRRVLQAAWPSGDTRRGPL